MAGRSVWRLAPPLLLCCSVIAYFSSLKTTVPHNPAQNGPYFSAPIQHKLPRGDIFINFRDIGYKVLFGIEPTLPCDGLVTVLVTSTAERRELRDWARKSWAQNSTEMGVAVVFVLAGHRNGTDLERENEIYGDLLVADFTESYNNLTLKSLAALAWVRRNCGSKFVLKTDSDVLISTPNLLRVVRGRWQSQSAIYGYVNTRVLPIRDSTNKWFTPIERYRHKWFPDYCAGAGYLMTTDVIQRLLYQVVNHLYLPIEDVFVTGILAEAAAVQRINSDGSPYDGIGCWNSKRQVAFHHCHAVMAAPLQKLWSQYLYKREQDCFLLTLYWTAAVVLVCSASGVAYYLAVSYNTSLNNFHRYLSKRCSFTSLK